MVTENLEIESTSVESIDNDTNVKASSSDGNEPKKKKKFKIPSALTILFGVLVGSIILTWIVHFITTGDYVSGESAIRVFETNDDGLWEFTGFWEGGNTWYITEGANAIIDGEWVVVNSDLSGINTPGDILNNEFGLITPIIDGDWFNFGDSNWYVSDDGMYGIGNVILSTFGGIFSAADLIFFIIGIGVIIELLMETNVLKSLVNSMISGMNNKRILLVPSLFVLFSLWGTIMGTQEATLALMPIVVPALIVAGFDAMTGFLVILVGVTTGIAASILEPFALGTLAGAFDKVWADSGQAGSIGIGTGIVLRIVLFVVYTSIGAAFVTWYGNRVLKSGKSVEDEEMQESNKEWAKVAFDNTEHKPLDKKQKIALGVVGAVMLWMVVVLLPWSSWIPSIEEQQWWITLSHLFFYDSLIGGWSFFQLGFLFIFGWFICAKVFGYTNKMMKNNWKNALSTFKTVSFILILSRATSIVLTNSGTATYLAETIFTSATDGLGPLGLSLVVFPIYVVMALAIPSMSGLAGISAPIIAPIVGGYTDPVAMKAAIIGIMALYPLAQGLVNMTSPTTGLVVAQAEASNTSYAKAVPLLVSYAAVIAVAGVVIVSLSFLV